MCSSRAALFAPGKIPGLPEPAQQLSVNFLLPGYHHVVGPPVGIGLHRHGNPWILQAAGQPEGHQQTVLRPGFLPAHRNGCGNPGWSGVTGSVRSRRDYSNDISSGIRFSSGGFYATGTGGSE